MAHTLSPSGSPKDAFGPTVSHGFGSCSPAAHAATTSVTTLRLLATLALLLAAGFAARAQTTIQTFLPCATVRGSGTTGSFTTAAPVITVNAACNADNYSIDWGDNSGFSTSPGPTFVTDHAYASAGPWLLTITDEAGSNSGAGETVVGLPSVQTDFLSGQTLNVLAKLAVGSQAPVPTSVTVQVACDSVVAPNGTLLPASTFGITCGPSTYRLTSTYQTVAQGPNGSNGPLPIPLCSPPGTACTGTPLPVGSSPTTFQVITTGTASTFALLHAQPPHSRAGIALAFALLSPGLLLRIRRTRLRSAPTLCCVLLLCLSLTCCGGGFKSPTLVSSATPPGNYQLNIVLTSTDTGFIQTTLIVPLTVGTSQ